MERDGAWPQDAQHLIETVAQRLDVLEHLVAPAELEITVRICDVGRAHALEPYGKPRDHLLDGRVESERAEGVGSQAPRPRRVVAVLAERQLQVDADDLGPRRQNGEQDRVDARPAAELERPLPRELDSVSGRALDQAPDPPDLLGRRRAIVVVRPVQRRAHRVRGIASTRSRNPGTIFRIVPSERVNSCDGSKRRCFTVRREYSGRG